MVGEQLYMEKESGHPYYEFAVCFADTGIQ